MPDSQTVLIIAFLALLLVGMTLLLYGRRGTAQERAARELNAILAEASSYQAQAREIAEKAEAEGRAPTAREQAKRAELLGRHAIAMREYEHRSRELQRELQGRDEF